MQKVMTKFGVMQVTRHNVMELQFMHSCWLTGYVCLLSMVDLQAMTKAVHVTIFHLMSVTFSCRATVAVLLAPVSRLLCEACSPLGTTCCCCHPCRSAAQAASA